MSSFHPSPLSIPFFFPHLSFPFSFHQNNELPEAKKKVEAAGEKLEALDEITSVHGRYYLLSSEYHRRMANHFKFYHEALR